MNPPTPCKSENRFGPTGRLHFSANSAWWVSATSKRSSFHSSKSSFVFSSVFRSIGQNNAAVVYRDVGRNL